MKKIIKNIFAFFNIAIRSKSKLEKKLANSVSMSKWEHDISFAIQIGSYLEPDFLKLMKLSKAQFRQDLFVLKELKIKRNGFFVEFGATDGVSGSNTFLLEKEFGYKAGQGGFAPGTKRDNAIINDIDRMADQVVAKYVEKQERFGKQKLRDSTEGGLTIDQLQEQIEFKKSKGDQSWRMDEITLKNKQKAQDLLNKYKS